MKYLFTATYGTQISSLPARGAWIEIDVGAFGKSESEMILQRGGTYEITKVYWGNDATDWDRRKIFVDIEIHPEEGYDLFQQDPSEWTGSRDNYHS